MPNPPWVANLRCAARHWVEDKASTSGAALAFYCAFSLAPLLVILLTLAGWVVGAEAAYGQIRGQLTDLFGIETARTLIEAVKSSQKAEGLLSTAVSVVTLLIGATTVLTALDEALEKIWKSDALSPRGLRGFIRTRLLSLGFILAIGFLLLVSLSVSTAISSLREYLLHHHAGIVSVIGVLDFAISLALIALLFAAIYRYMPVRRTPWRDVLIGGLLTAVLFNIGRWVIGLYLAHSTQPSAYGAAASFAALLLWLYYSAQIFLFGAEYTACLAGIHEKDA